MIILPIKKIIADQTKMYLRLNLKNKRGTNNEAVIMPIIYKVNDKLTLFSVTWAKVAIKGLAIPPGINMQRPKANVKIQMLKIPITFVFLGLAVKLSSLIIF